MNEARWTGGPAFAAKLFGMAKKGDLIANAASDNEPFELEAA
jgi:hypothetical protein